jgi:hypothetical protein
VSDDVSTPREAERGKTPVGIAIWKLKGSN